MQLLGIRYLYAKVIETGLPPPRRDCKIYPGVVEHPLGIVGFYDRWPCCEQRRVEANGVLKVLDSDVDVHALHEMPPSSWDFGTLAARRLAHSYGQARVGRASAAVVGEVGEQLGHGVIPRRVDHRPAISAHGDQLRIPETVKMETQGIRR
jgi:hypothetical protein